MRRLIGRARSIWGLECSSERLLKKSRRLSGYASLVIFALSLLDGSLLRAQPAWVEARVAYKTSSRKDAPPDASNVVFWLTPLSDPLVQQAAVTLARLPHRFQLVQSHKRFDPHLLVVPIGSVVDFPNRDPFFHNVFSLFNGKRFDLGLYEAGSTRSVKFDRAGISFIFCNIHPQMGAVVVTLKTPYYGVTNKSGVVKIPNVPDGRYHLGMWSERALPKTLKSLAREVTIRQSASNLGSFEIRASGDLLAGHKNMYGRDYDPVAPLSFPYEQSQ